MAAAPLFQIPLRNGLQSEKRCARQSQLSNSDVDDASYWTHYSVQDTSIRPGRIMNRFAGSLAVAVFLSAPPVFASEEAAPKNSYRLQLPLVIYGQVTNIDHMADLVSIRQVMPKNVGMAPLTTVFKANDAASLGSIQEGDKVKAIVESIDGQPVVLKVWRRRWPIQ
jgi:Cu/Ag efflux protein CusF